MNISDILYKKGYKYVEGTEAQHKETYSVFVNFHNACDISYVPKNIYHKIPFIEIDGIHFTHPSFIMIDMYREYTNPYFSSFRWLKTFPRMVKLQKYYPFNKATKPLSDISEIKKLDANSQKIHSNIIGSIFEFLKNRESVVLFGKYAYNQYLHESDIMKDKTLGDKYKYVDIDHYQFISIDYKKDALELLDHIYKKFPEQKDDITIVEYYPFWMFLGYSAQIFYKGVPIFYIVNYNRKCVTIKKVKPYIFDKKSAKLTDSKSLINICSYSFQLLMTIILAFKNKVDGDSQKYQFYNIMISHLVEIRNYYLKKNKKTMFDNTLFQEFMEDCIGEIEDPVRESRLERKMKAKEKKGPIVFRYHPEDGKKESNYRFPNSSGNPIRNQNNFRIIESKDN